MKKFHLFLTLSLVSGIIFIFAIVFDIQHNSHRQKTDNIARSLGESLATSITANAREGTEISTVDLMKTILSDPTSHFEYLDQFFYIEANPYTDVWKSYRALIPCDSPLTGEEFVLVLRPKNEPDNWILVDLFGGTRVVNRKEKEIRAPWAYEY